MTKGVSEKFDEHEHDTARRDYPKEVVDGSRRTVKMAALDPSSFRTESGTRAVLTPDAIERHLQQRMADALADVDRTSGIEDPHSRPTIEAGILGAIHAQPDIDFPAPSASLPAAPPVGAALPSDLLATASRPTPLSAVAAPAVRAPEQQRSSSIAGWLVAVMIFGVLFMVSAAGAVGFALGRRSAGR
ncbi:MAG: hypothetical protein J0I07_39340 [Myxococcales bacterium]|nr:hypothetical protein [Myxococcales bacterium]